jgi:hypothetical protein
VLPPNEGEGVSILSTLTTWGRGVNLGRLGAGMREISLSKSSRSKTSKFASAGTGKGAIRGAIRGTIRRHPRQTIQRHPRQTIQRSTRSGNSPFLSLAYPVPVCACNSYCQLVSHSCLSSSLQGNFLCLSILVVTAGTVALCLSRSLPCSSSSKVKFLLLLCIHFSLSLYSFCC